MVVFVILRATGILGVEKEHRWSKGDKNYLRRAKRIDVRF